MRYRAYEIHMCNTVEEKTACRDFAYERMLSDEHGLKDRSYAAAQFDDVSDHVYLAAYEHGNDELVATLRLRCDYDVSRYTNLNGDILRYDQAGGRLADGGTYTTEPFGRGLDSFQGMFVLCVRFLLEQGIHGIYIQARTKRVRFYKRIGFSLVGEPFEEKGWAYTWHPMLMRLDEVPVRFDDPKFQASWFAEVGERLSLPFWREVMPLISADTHPDEVSVTPFMRGRVPRIFRSGG